MSNTVHKKIVLLVLSTLVVALWAYHLTRIEIEFLQSHIDGLLVCSPENNPAPGGLSEAEWETAHLEAVTALKEVLTSSNNPETRVLGIINYSDLDDSGQITQIADLANRFPENRLVNLHFLNACAKNASHTLCDTRSVEEANAVNAENSVSWSLLAIYRNEMQNEFGVDRAMLRAANAPEFEDYFGAQVGIMRDAFPPESGFNQWGLAWDVLARSRLVLNNGYQVSYLCSVEDPARISLFESCLKFGERMQAESQSLIMTLVGGGIQQTAYSSMGNEEAARRIEREYMSSQYRRRDNGSVWAEWDRAGSLMTYDVDLTLFWLDSIVEYGETETAILRVVEEAKRLSSDPEYRPCRPPRPILHYI